MMKMKYILPCLAGVFFSCADDVVPVSSEIHEVALDVKTEIIGSRAMIMDSKFGDGATLGITLVDAKDGVFTYDGLTDGYRNIQYQSVGTGADQYWKPADKPIYLSSTDGRALAYYPWSVDGSDYTSLSIKADEQVDYMYSGWYKPLNNLYSEATFQMKHAMTGIRINIKRGSYTGTGLVSEVWLESTAFGISGKLDATTGAITDVKDGNINTYMLENPAFQSFEVNADDYTPVLLMAVPKADIKDDVQISVVVDGRTYEVDGLMAQAFKSGTLYTFNLTLDNTALTVSGDVKITEWVEDDTASTDNGGVLKPTA